MGIAEYANILTDQLATLPAFFDSEILMAATLLMLTAGIVSLGVPGLLLPLSFSSGLLLGGWIGGPVVLAGAALGSHGLFLAARYGMGDKLEARIAGRLEGFHDHLENYGMAYVAGLRVIGTPHLLVTVASAATPIRHRAFAMASVLGFLPAIALSAGAGSAV